MWFNYHTHSNYCDGKLSLVDYVRSAQHRKMHSLGFSSHAPLPFDCKWCMKPEMLKTYLLEIDSLKKEFSNIEIYKSLEIDFIPGAISPGDFKNELDYTIGSVHFADQASDGTRLEIDGSHNVFLTELKTVYNNNIREAIVRYFELTCQMINTSCPDIIGHMDKMKIQNIDNKFFSEHDTWYKDAVVKTLNEIEKAGAIVEVNTRGIYQSKSSTTYPSPWILSIIHKKNIPITLNSDAHHPDDLINTFQDTALLLRKIGFTKISGLQGGVWKQFDFDEHGVKV
jgi:histidinol-phosphatase (PHP family)